MPEPVKAGEDKKDLIDRLNEQHDWPFRLVGLYPLDNEIPDFGPDRETGWRVKVRGQWAYLYRALDKLGNTIDFYLSATRNTKAA